MTSELRTQFINFMTMQRFSRYTKKNYITAVKGLAMFYNQSPETLTNDQVQEYFRHLLEDRKYSWGTCNNYFSGIASFYRNVCKWEETTFTIPPRPRIRKLPVPTQKKAGITKGPDLHTLRHSFATSGTVHHFINHCLSEMTPSISFQCCVYAIRTFLFFMAMIDKTLFNEVHTSAKVWISHSKYTISK